MKPSNPTLTLGLIVLLWTSLLLSSCAVATRGSSQLVPIDSVPVGAEVFVNGELVGHTPLELELARSSEHLITLRWNGQERSFTLQPELDGEGTNLLIADAVPGGIVMGLSAVSLASCGRGSGSGWFDFSGMCRDFSFLGIGAGAVLAALPMAIDAGTGGIYRLSPSEVFVAFD